MSDTLRSRRRDRIWSLIKSLGEVMGIIRISRHSRRLIEDAKLREAIKLSRIVISYVRTDIGMVHVDGKPDGVHADLSVGLADADIPQVTGRVDMTFDSFEEALAVAALLCELSQKASDVAKAMNQTWWAIQPKEMTEAVPPVDPERR
jgi:hypothetical protein